MRKREFGAKEESPAVNHPVPLDPGPLGWTAFGPVKTWCKAFGINAKTLRERIAAGSICGDYASTKLLRIAVRDIPKLEE